MDKKTITIIITAILAVGVLLILFFGPEKLRLDYDLPVTTSSAEKIEKAMQDLTAPSSKSLLSPEEEATALEKLTAPIK